jgi:DNA-binding MarR family transcriptional regulator
MNEMETQKNIIRFLEALSKISKIIASMESYIGDLTLSKFDLIALECISNEPNLIMTKFAKSLGIGLSTATGIIDRLVKKKLAIRERNHGDRRVVKISLTEKGEKIYLDFQKEKKKVIEKILRILSVKEQMDFVLIIEKIVNKLSEED